MKSTSLALAVSTASAVMERPTNRLQKVAASNAKMIVEDNDALPIESSTRSSRLVLATAISANVRAIMEKYGARLLNVAFLSEGAKFRQGIKTAYLPRFAIVNPFSSQNEARIDDTSVTFDDLIRVAFPGAWIRKPMDEIWIPNLCVSALISVIGWLFIAFAPHAFNGKMATEIMVPLFVAWNVMIRHISLTKAGWWDTRRFLIPVRFKAGTIPSESRALIKEIKALGDVSLIFEAERNTYDLGSARITEKVARDPDPLIVLAVDGHFLLMGSFNLTSAEYRAVKSFTSGA